MRVLVTGAAGFIGSALLESLGRKGIEAVGVDNFSTYYSPAYKLARLKHLGFPFDSFPADNSHSSTLNSKLTLSSQFSTLSFVRLDVCDRSAMRALFVRERFTHVVHLAAQPGVRRSLTHPYDYLRNNIEGFLTLLETVREYPVEHLVYASSSSVYGTNSKIPFSESDPVDRPESLYAASKRSDELMAHVYARLYGVPATGLRFFTVYGPWGRPDMAPMLFGRAIMEGKSIRVFNHGEMKRDFTYIDDIVGGIEKVLFGGWKQEGLHVYNIGHGSPVDLMEFIGLLEKCLGREAPKEMLGMQPGDVPLTYADTSALAADYGYRADTPLEEGLRAFAEWLKDYRKDG
mgnify:FL=1|jgi:UDP-glucuronate 4-epimerase